MTEQEYIKHVDDSITEIKSIDFSKSWAYEKVVYSMLKIEKLPIILYQYEEDNIIFRSRINSSNKFYTKESEISIPEEKFVLNYGRANKPKQSLFYGSENRPTSYAEFIDDLVDESLAGDMVLFTIGGWRLKESPTLVLVFNPEDSRNNKYNETHRAGFEDFIRKMPKELRKGTVKFFSFIGDEFSKVAKYNIGTYYITTAYSNIVFGEEKSDGIIYPSVPSGGDGFNIAIKKDWINKKNIDLEIARMDKFNLVLEESGKYNFLNIDSRDAKSVNNGEIKWNE